MIDFIDYLVRDYKIRDIRESHVLGLHKLAIQNIYDCGGTYRDARVKVEIANSPHEIPEPALVPSLVNEAIDWLNKEQARSPLEKAAYALWRFNWIHPFRGGNGRTSRAIAYLILCSAEGTMLSGTPVMPDLIYDRRDDYIAALHTVDASAKTNPDQPDFSAMSSFLRDIVTTQLTSVITHLSLPQT